MNLEQTTIGIDRASPVPYYLQLSSLIEHSISSGLLGPGDRLPTESDLCRDYDLARSTVRETLRHLANQGRIKMVPRRGAFVLEQNPSDWRLQVTQGFFEAEVDRHRRSVETNVLEAGFEPLPENAAAGLDLDVNTIGFKLARVRRLDGKLALYSVNYLPANIGQVISRSDVISGSGSLNRTLTNAGYKVYGARRSVEAIGANKDISKLLEVPRNHPLLLVTSVSWGQDDKPFDFYMSWIRSDVVTVSVEAQAPIE